MEPHTWNANGQDFICIVIIHFPPHFPYKQIQHFYAKVTTDHKKSPVYFNVTSPRMGSPAQQGHGTLQCWCTKALPERSSALSEFSTRTEKKRKKRRSRRRRKKIQLRNTLNSQNRYFYPHKKAALEFSLALETSVLISTVHWSQSPSSVLKTSPQVLSFFVVVLCN